MGRSHRKTSSLKLLASPPIDLATSSSSVDVMQSAEGLLLNTVKRSPPRTKTADSVRQPGRPAARGKYIASGTNRLPGLTLSTGAWCADRRRLVGGRQSIAVESPIKRPTESESMPREMRNRPANGTAQRPLASLLAHSTTPNALLPHLHQYALDASGGSCSLLFQHNPRTGGLQATSGFGLEVLKTDPWLPGPDEAAVVADAFARRMPTLVDDTARQTPDLASRLQARAGLLLPLIRRGERVG